MALGLYDFSSPFMTARIITAVGKSFPLWFSSKGDEKSSGASGSSTKTPTCLPFLQELTVDLGLGFVPVIKAVLTPPFEDAVKILDSELVEIATNKLEVQFGYTGSSKASKAVLSPIFTGLMLKPDISLGTDISITLNAQGVGGFGMLRGETNVSSKPTPRRKIIESLVQGPNSKYPRKLKVSFDAVKSAEARRLLDEPISFTQAGNPDFYAVYRLVTESLCWCYFDEDTLRVVSREDSTQEQPTKKFLFMHYPTAQLGPCTSTFPILSFTSPTSAVWLPQSARGIVSNDIDPKERKYSTKVIVDKISKTPKTDKGQSGVSEGEASDPEKMEKDGTGASRWVSPHGSKEAEAAINAEFQNLQQFMGIEVEIDSVGVPDLMPGEMVEVQGMGTRFGGRYGVFKITHTLGTSGYNTQFTAVSNVQKLLYQGIQAYGSANTKSATSEEQGKKKVNAVVDSLSSARMKSSVI